MRYLINLYIATGSSPSESTSWYMEAFWDIPVLERHKENGSWAVTD